MKTLTFAFIITIAAALGFTKAAFAGDVQNTFQISNQQAVPLGQVTATTPDGNFFGFVGGNSVVPIQTQGNAISVTINNQIVPQGVQAIVTLQDGTAVQVLWTSPNSITVIDEGELR